MDDNTPTPTEEKYVPPKNNLEELLLHLEMVSSFKLDSEPFEKILPTWQNDIVVSEFFRMLTPYVQKHPEHKDILID